MPHRPSHKPDSLIGGRALTIANPAPGGISDPSRSIESHKMGTIMEQMNQPGGANVAPGSVQPAVPAKLQSNLIGTTIEQMELPGGADVAPEKPSSLTLQSFIGLDGNTNWNLAAAVVQNNLVHSGEWFLG
jgi:hypothetical protein